MTLCVYGNVDSGHVQEIDHKTKSFEFLSIVANENLNANIDIYGISFDVIFLMLRRNQFK